MPVHADALETMNQWLAGHLGPNRSSVAPASYYIDLWIDNPQNDSPSLADWDGYTAPVWSSDDWLTPEGGQVESDGLPDFGVPSSTGTDAARYWSLSTSPGVPVYSAPLESPFRPPEGGGANPVQIRLTVPFGGRN